MDKTDNTQDEKTTKKIDVKGIIKTAAKGIALGAKGVASSFAAIKTRKIKEAAEKLRQLEETLARYENERASLMTELDQVSRTIIEKKKLYEKAPPFKKSILKSELERFLAQHANLKRRIVTILHNEKSLSEYISRIKEMEDIKDIPLTEVHVDKLIDNLEDAVDDSMGVGDALKDLSKVKGISSESMDSDDFNAQLDMFGDELGDDIPMIDGFTSALDSSNAEQEDSASELEEPIKD